MTSATRTELLDSLLHTDYKRVFTGIICGLASGILFVFLTSLMNVEGGGRLWWLQVTGSIFYGGRALSFEVPQEVLVAGSIVHFGLSALCGFLFGKMTTSNRLFRLAGYGLVLGGLCWLASNMFAPDFVNFQAMDAFPQWCRIFVFVSFGVSLGVFMSVAGKILRSGLSDRTALT